MPFTLFVLNIAPEPPPSKPNFISHLVPDLKIPHREPLVLKALLEGYPSPNINWFKDGTLLKNEPRYEQSYSNGEVTLKVAECVQDDGGVFSCLATNLAGQDSTSCNVTVGGVLKHVLLVSDLLSSFHVCSSLYWAVKYQPVVTCHWFLYIGSLKNHTFGYYCLVYSGSKMVLKHLITQS